MGRTVRGKKMTLFHSTMLTGLLSVGAVGFALLVGADDAQAQGAQAGATYDSVLASPDDAALNMRFLEAQLASGDFSGASTTLQRILLNNPDYDQVRLVRAAVLLRLGDHAGAAIDLAVLENRPLSAADRAEAERLKNLVRPNSDALRVSGVVRFGGFYASNPGQSPGTGTVSSGSFSFADDGRTGAFGELQFLGQLPFGGGAGHEMQAQGHVFSRVYDDGDDAQIFANLAVGPRLDAGFAFFDLMAIAGLELLDGDVAATHVGGRVDVTVDVSNAVSASLRVQLVHDGVDVGLRTAASPGDADGYEASVRPAITFQPNEAWQLQAHAYGAIKEAGSDWFSFEAYGGGLSTRYRAANGFQLQLSGSVQWVDYSAVNPSLAGEPAREDMRIQLGLNSSVPLVTLVRALGADDAAWADGWGVEGYAHYYYRDSNIAIYDTDGWTLGLSMARQFSM